MFLICSQAEPVCTYVCMYVCMYVCLIYVYMYVCVCMYVCIYICLYVCMYACMSSWIFQKVTASDEHGVVIPPQTNQSQLKLL